VVSFKEKIYDPRLGVKRRGENAPLVGAHRGVLMLKKTKKPRGSAISTFLAGFGADERPALHQVPVRPLRRGLRRKGTDFMKLDFGQKVLGQLFTLGFHPWIFILGFSSKNSRQMCI
jgi:hypothetical protein